MGQIHLLDKETAELIAAGEVIDRPASVIKELCENALDAGATQVTVEIQRGGVTFMRVTDNGCGIAPEDIRTAFLRHATSKLSTSQDLQNILTMGFRGEALASVAAMCRVEVFSRVPGAKEGVRYRIEGGQELLCEPAGCPEGTTIVIRDIFYNTPARMKFLKKDITEGGAVGVVVDRFAAINPRVSVKFLRDGKTVLQTPGNNRLSDSVYAVWGRDFFRTLTPAKADNRGVRVTGFVSKPALGRGNRTMQHFFLNGRPIRSGTCTAALEEAFRTRMMKGKYPACVLDIRMPPGVYDVNVHPAKLEVRFAEEKLVFDAVYCAALSAFTSLERQGVEVRLPDADVPAKPAADVSLSAASPRTVTPSAVSAPAVSAARPASVQTFQPAKPGRDVPPSPRPTWTERIIPEPVAEQLDLHQTSVPLRIQSAPQEKMPLPAAPAAPQPAAVSAVSDTAQEQKRRGRYDGARLIGEWLRTYVLLEWEEQLILIDKHAAHERLLYEEFKRTSVVSRQVLLDPVTLTLPKDEYAAALEKEDILRKLGFLTENFGEGCIMIREIPTMLALDDAAPSVAELCGRLAAGVDVSHVEAIDEMFHMIACKAAIKAHDVTSARELEELVRLLNEHDDVRFCPHGRSIAVTMSRHQIEKLFGRTM